MSHEPSNGERLPEAAVKRVLDRATALDAEHGASVPVEVLRAAARDAGISTQAFDAALAEERRAAVAPKSPKSPRWAVLAVIAVNLVVVVLTVSALARSKRSRSPVNTGLVEETFVLRCVDQAAVSERIRANVREKGMTRMWFNSREPRLVHVRATPAVMTKVRAEVVAAEEQAPSCTTAPG